MRGRLFGERYAAVADGRTYAVNTYGCLKAIVLHMQAVDGNDTVPSYINIDRYEW